MDREARFASLGPIKWGWEDLLKPLQPSGSTAKEIK